MDKVITVNDFWDGPKLGLATLDGIPCIYERVFSDDLDNYTDFYNLTPITPETVDIVIKDWNNWLQWMEKDHSRQRAVIWQSERSVSLANLAQRSKSYHKYCKRAKFQGTYCNGYTEINNFYVTWF